LILNLDDVQYTLFVMKNGATKLLNELTVPHCATASWTTK
jgi:hypothetical protein